MEIEETDHPVQNLSAPDSSHKFEGLAFSPSGNTMAVASSQTDTVFLFRRKPDGLFEDAPFSHIDRPGSNLNYPHDLSFGLLRDTELLAVAHRTGLICVYQKHETTDDYGKYPIFEIRGRKTRLRYREGVAFEQSLLWNQDLFISREYYGELNHLLRIKTQGG